MTFRTNFRNSRTSEMFKKPDDIYFCGVLI